MRIVEEEKELNEGEILMREILSHSLCSGQKGLIRFRFDIPEVVKPGTMMIFREKGVQGMGYVT